MGAGYHGGFGNTAGAMKGKIITADASFVGNLRIGRALADASKKIKKEEGFTDVAVHGNPKSIAIFRLVDGEEKAVFLTHRSLAKYLKTDKGYTGGNIRLISCSTGSEKGSFAQNLANKMGVAVKAPSETLHIWPDGKIVLGPNPFTNTGKWITYYPNKKRKKG